MHADVPLIRFGRVSCHESGHFADDTPTFHLNITPMESAKIANYTSIPRQQFITGVLTTWKTYLYGWDIITTRII